MNPISHRIYGTNLCQEIVTPRVMKCWVVKREQAPALLEVLQLENHPESSDYAVVGVVGLPKSDGSVKLIADVLSNSGYPQPIIRYCKQAPFLWVTADQVVYLKIKDLVNELE